MAMAMPKSNPCVGVDTGTNNTCLVGLVSDGVPAVIKSIQGESLHPSAVFYPETSDGDILVGREALAKFPHQNLVTQVKRTFGISLAEAKKNNLLHTFNAKVAKGPWYKKAANVSTTRKAGRGGKAKASSEPQKVPETQVGVRFLITQDGKVIEKTAEEVMEDMIKKFVNLVQTNHGEKVDYVFSRPQYWDQTRTELFQGVVKDAIGPLGTLVAIITEPNAAQFAYQACIQGMDAKQRVFVFDLGGGTWDLSYILELSPGIYQGVCTGGDDFLGGANIEREFLSTMKEEMKQLPTFKPNTFEKRETEFLVQLKDMKHKLSITDSVKMDVYGCSDEPYTFTIDKEKKRVILKEFYQKIDKAIDRCFEKKVKGTEKTADDLKGSVQRAFLVGGAMRDDMLSIDYFKKKLPNADIIGKPGTKGALNPDEVVAMGNSLWCAAKKKVATKISLPPDPRHRDILNKSIGIKGVEAGPDGLFVHKFCSIITANTEIPTCGSRTGFPTCEDNQNSVLIEVYQGEGEFTDTDECKPFNQYTVPLRVPNKVDEIFVDVEIEVTKDNFMIVRAGEKGRLEEIKFDFHN